MNERSLTKKTVLVLDAESAAGLETVQSLGRNGCLVDALTIDCEQARAKSRFIRKHFVAGASDERLISQIIGLFSAERYDLIVPTTEAALLAMLSPAIPDDIYERAVCPSRINVQTALNKEKVWQLAQTLGIKVPLSRLVTLDSLPPETFPVVLKPVLSKKNINGEIRGFRVTIARDLGAWRKALETQVPGMEMQQQQEYIPGRGVGVEVLFDHGIPRWVFMHERLHELPLTGGGSSYRASIPLDKPLVDSAVRLLTALEWHGVAMVEYKIDAKGEAYLIEINPRLWGSLSLAIDCGMDFPLGLLYLASHQPLPPQPKYRVGYYARNVYRDVEWFKHNLKADHSDELLLTRPAFASACEWLRPLLGRESWDFFCWSDLRVVLGEWKKIVAEHWKRLVARVALNIHKLYLAQVQQPKLLRKLSQKKIHRVLVLCHGNICRSPLAARLGTEKFPDVSFASAGFYEECGRRSPGFVVEEAALLGIDLGLHQSKRVDQGMIEDADVIVMMDLRNRNALRREFRAALEKAVLLATCLRRPELEIRDPYDDPSTMHQVASKINEALDGFGKVLGNSSQRAQRPEPRQGGGIRPQDRGNKIRNSRGQTSMIRTSMPPRPAAIAISAVIPAFNAERTIGDAIKSVLAQTRPVNEIIVVDDGSSDRTAEVAARFPGVLVLRRPNGGPGAARNTGIKAAKSEWIAFLDSDDVWLPRKTEIQIACISPETGVVYCNRFDPITFGALWHRQAYITPSGALVRKEALLEVGGFEESRAVISVEDLNLWLKIATTKWKFVRSEPNLFTYQPTAASLSANHMKMAHAELTCIDLIARRVGCPLLESERIRQACRVEYARNLIADKRWGDAKQLLGQAKPDLTSSLLAFICRLHLNRLGRRDFFNWLQSMNTRYTSHVCSGECALSPKQLKDCMDSCQRPYLRVDARKPGNRQHL